jgi:hypothetical protein
MFYYNQLTHWNDTNDLFHLCKGPLGVPIPCASVYSHMKPYIAEFYAVMLIFLALFRLRNSFSSLVRVYSVQFEEGFENDREEFIYSQMMFNSWNWSTNNKIDYLSSKSANINI